jgi:hypothetical protein
MSARRTLSRCRRSGSMPIWRLREPDRRPALSKATMAPRATSGFSPTIRRTGQSAQHERLGLRSRPWSADSPVSSDRLPEAKPIEELARRICAWLEAPRAYSMLDRPRRTSGPGPTGRRAPVGGLHAGPEFLYGLTGYATPANRKKAPPKRG